MFFVNIAGRWKVLDTDQFSYACVVLGHQGSQEALRAPARWRLSSQRLAVLQHAGGAQGGIEPFGGRVAGLDGGDAGGLIAHFFGGGG